ncbi:hypothetical protein HS088_TW12G00621 [Tripterygium wilfordii]|uniref:Uncharacterized protein n=1 Tax=Tripterygium wilfordii TaxID=458696 RepID=A0A7J7D027_TRIWF|nr:uncharacterized protein LOC120010334 [Tripterygium wilfordii]KAF5739416.1 hypothetical protein HS088_TW12G00621 [Tripterygium wilfordii]
MNLQSVCHGIVSPLAKLKFSSSGLIPHQAVSAIQDGFKDERARPRIPSRFDMVVPVLRNVRKGLNRGVVACASSSDSSSKLKLSGDESASVPVSRFGGVEPFRGKSGAVSFHGLTHQLMEERKLLSAPFIEDKSSFLWVLAPVALIASLLLPQFFLGAIFEGFFTDELVVEIVTSLTSEALFYVGLATFLIVADFVQRPYLEFSPRRWGLITGLRGYLTSAFFATGFKVVAPLFVVYVTWPVLGLPAFVAVAPYLVGFVAQRAFEMLLDKRGSSCWPLVPIIFEVYRLYQLTKAAHFIERLAFAMRGLPESPQLLERSNALLAMVVTFQVLGLVCLWSLVTFLLRLFPSRPVAENY